MGSQAEESDQREDHQEGYVIFKSWSEYVCHMFLVCSWVIIAAVLLALAWFHFVA